MEMRTTNSFALLIFMQFSALAGTGKGGAGGAARG
jgi:hypothetical protein